MSDKLSHYGTPRHSGRYKWGSGDDPQQRNTSFLGRVEEMKKKGLSEKEIAEGLGMNTSQLRVKKSLAKAEQRKADYSQALKWKDKGMSNVEIGNRLGINESSVRALLNPAIQERSETTNNIANTLKDTVAKKQYVDVGVGVERFMGIHRTKLKTAISQLEEDGHIITYVPVEQLGTGKKTNMMVLSRPEKREAAEIINLTNKGKTDDEIASIMKMSKEEAVALRKEAYSDVFKNKGNIKMVTDHSEDGGRSFLGLEPIRSISSDRVHIRYTEDGGSDKDGVIELRRGVSELSLGKSNYAQVRVGVDGTHYLKGMAIYSDDIPKGKDVIYNTNKAKGTPKEKVFKEMKDDPDNPFGATVKQQHHITEEGKKIKGSAEMLELKQKGLDYSKIAEKMGVSEDIVRKAVAVKALNIVNEEGDWSKWSKTISSQVLSKQTPALAQKQLGLAFDVKKEEFDEIMSLTNPAIRKKLLESFADDCDSSAVHLKAAALPRQGSHVILPFPTMKETEVYAPNYNDGERVVLIRYPHGGRFEIPELIVNNKHKEARSTIGQAKDGIGIHPKVAERLSGADFDGDTVLVIPNTSSTNTRGIIKTEAPLKGLMHFDPKINYAPHDGMITIDGGVYSASTGKVDYRGKNPNTRTKQMKMGDVSNLITDMTIKGANPDDLAAAVRHSMVVIDAEKHKLDYKQSYVDNNIAGLKKRYQGSERSGASTLVSKASSDARVHTRKEITNVDKMTPEQKKAYLAGEKVYEYTNETYVKRTLRKDGSVKETEMFRTISSSKMAEAKDAFDLSSGTPMETVYATHANKLKALGNSSRKVVINTPPILQNKDAKEKYKAEINSLKASLNIALKNAPLERQAQVVANAVVATKREANPGADADQIKKWKGQALAEARARFNAKKDPVVISPREWEAIQAGAISNNTLSSILNNTDLDRIKELATPRAFKELTPAKQQRAKAMLASGRTQSEIASALGVSTSAINKLID